MIGWSSFILKIIDKETKKWNKKVITLGRAVRKPVNGNPGLKVNRRINFSCIKMFFTSYISRKLRLLKLKTEDQTI